MAVTMEEFRAGFVESELFEPIQKMLNGDASHAFASEEIRQVVTKGRDWRGTSEDLSRILESLVKRGEFASRPVLVEGREIRHYCSKQYLRA